MNTIKLSVLTCIVGLATVTGELSPKVQRGGSATRKRTKTKQTTKKKAPATKPARARKKPARARKKPVARTERPAPMVAPAPVAPEHHQAPAVVRTPVGPHDTRSVKDLSLEELKGNINQIQSQIEREAHGLHPSDLGLLEARVSELRAEVSERFIGEFLAAWKDLSSKNPSKDDLEFFLADWEAKERRLAAHLHEDSGAILNRIKKMVRDEIETLSKWYWRGWRWAKSTAGWAGKAAYSEFEDDVTRLREAAKEAVVRKATEGVRGVGQRVEAGLALKKAYPNDPGSPNFIIFNNSDDNLLLSFGDYGKRDAKGNPRTISSARIRPKGAYSLRRDPNNEFILTLGESDREEQRRALYMFEFSEPDPEGDKTVYLGWNGNSLEVLVDPLIFYGLRDERPYTPFRENFTVGGKPVRYDLSNNIEAVPPMLTREAWREQEEELERELEGLEEQ